MKHHLSLPRFAAPILQFSLIFCVISVALAPTVWATRCDEPISEIDATPCGLALTQGHEALVKHDRRAQQVAKQMKLQCRTIRRASSKITEKRAQKIAKQSCLTLKNDVNAKVFAQMLLQSAVGQTEESCRGCQAK